MSAKQLSALCLISASLMLHFGLSHAKVNAYDVDVDVKATRVSGEKVHRYEYTTQSVDIFFTKGIATTIELPNDEVIVKTIYGYREGWEEEITGRFISLKMLGADVSGNLTVIGKKRTYLFKLIAGKADVGDTPYLLVITAPKETGEAVAPPAKYGVRPKLVVMNKSGREADYLTVSDKFKLAQFDGALNFEYVAQGARSLQPLATHDNGRSTYLTFSSAYPLPAVFIIEDTGIESTADYAIDSETNTIVVPRVVGRIMLRRDNLVCGITNKNFNAHAVVNRAGTSTDNVIRTLKE